MNTNTYECSYVEVLEILKHIPKKQYDMIPKTQIEFYEKNKDSNYKYIYNGKRTISKKAQAILVNLYKDYIANVNEKNNIERILKLNEQKLELKKQNLYNPSNIFQDKENNSSIMERESLIECSSSKEKWYKKIMNKVNICFTVFRRRK